MARKTVELCDVTNGVTIERIQKVLKSLHFFRDRSLIAFVNSSSKNAVVYSWQNRVVIIDYENDGFITIDGNETVISFVLKSLKRHKLLCSDICQTASRCVQHYIRNANNFQNISKKRF